MSAIKILVIDDDEHVRSLVVTILKMHGYEVSTAGNGIEGLERFKENPADLVICDILMPEKEGLETIAELRQLNSSIKIIAISGGSKTLRFDPLEVARRFGAHCALGKPFGKDDLMKAVNATLGLSASSQPGKKS